MSLYTKISDLQKLSAAWDCARKNKPSAGVDNITYEMFEENKRLELKQLQIELADHTYEPLPVRQVVLYKGEKSRTIALYSMRDKVVQQSLAQELGKIYEPMFSESAYAYRNGKSALAGLSAIEEEVTNGKWEAVLKLDIKQFFDTIIWKKLEAIMNRQIHEEDVLELIRQNAMTRVLDDTGELIPKTSGIHQGSAIAPVLSNIYMMDFDAWMGEENVYYLRYSDDILILGQTEEQLLQLKDRITKQLEQLGLDLNDNKTICQSLDKEFEFLGHAFSQKGMTIPQKAKDELQEKLETVWMTPGLDLKKKVEKSSEIVGGWEQYFRENRTIGSIFEYTALVGNNRKHGHNPQKLVSLRSTVHNEYKDIALYLAEFWKNKDMQTMELREYEEFYNVPNLTKKGELPDQMLQELLAYYRSVMINPNQEAATEIMQIYTDAHQYENASFWMQFKKQEGVSETPAVLPVVEEKKNPDHYLNADTAKKIMKYFAGREDIYAIDTLGYGGKRQVELQLKPLTEAVITDHLQGKKTIGTYIQRPNSTVKCIILDIDVSKRILLQYDRGTPEFKEYMALAYQKAEDAVKLYQKWGLKAYIEYSGCRGYHVWLIATEWIPVRYANMFCDLVERSLEMTEDITVEYFPNKTRIKPGKYGQCIKLPYGRHGKTGEQSCFLDDNGERITEINSFLDSLARYPLSAIKKILVANTDFKEQKVQPLELDEDAFGPIPDSVRAVLENCSLMKYLCRKALKTGYLSHFERLSILYTFGHMGEEGREFIHTVMGKTLNYQFQTTDKFIRKIPDKPISCVKLREQYKNITAEYGCSCNFKRTKNCYPSPVLHAISLSPDASSQITIPTSRSLTKEKEQKVLEELNIHKKAEELAGKILELKKQRRRLDRSVEKTENELSKLFDSQDINCLETEMGLLVRRKKGERYEWVIEL